MKNKFYSLFLSLFLVAGVATMRAQAPAQSDAVMLQGFYWDSNATTSWNNLYAISGDISGVFDVVWLPPSAYSSGGTGYMPREWHNQTSAWGTASHLTRLITALNANDCRAMADIVVNHRDGKTTWNDFYADNFGTYGSFQLTSAHICSNDECVAAGYAATGALDTGDNFEGARDLDHTSSYVQNTVKAYMQWMRNVMGYDGWRYDMVKGFGASYIQGYNTAGAAYMSVGEYWDANYDAVWGWIQGTNYTSMAFDFPQKYAALNIGLQTGNYAAMQWADNGTPRPAGLAHSPQSRRFSVTFVDNHDTYRDGSKYNGDVLKANAYILSSPGIPCIFYPHWTANKTDINNMIKARKSIGMHSESTVTVTNTTGYYEATSVGTCGTMITRIGSWEGEPSGYTLACSGNGWAMYTNVTNTACGNAYQTKIDNGINPTPDAPLGTVTLRAIVPAGWTAPKIWLWDANGSSADFNGGATWPGQAMTSQGDGVYSITVSNVTTSELGVVINNGAATGTLQTIDLFASANTCWELGAVREDGKYDAFVNEACVRTATEISEVTSMQLYPNPTEKVLNIVSEQNVETVSIWSTTGQRLLEADNQSSLDVSTLTKGIYLVRVVLADGSRHAQTFVKR